MPVGPRDQKLRDDIQKLTADLAVLSQKCQLFDDEQLATLARQFGAFHQACVQLATTTGIKLPSQGQP